MEDHLAGRKLFDRKKMSGSGLISHMTKVENLLGFPIAYFSDKDVESKILFSLNNSKNILNQAGVFTWNADPSKPLEMVGDEQFRLNKKEEEINYRFCSCFNINKKLSVHIRNRLEADGITKEFVYPTPGISTWGIFEKATNNKTSQTEKSIKKKKRKKRTNREIVEYWLKKRRKKSTRIKRKKRKTNNNRNFINR
jgi:hypothetical protein